jgi:Rieske Fe-S protein
MIKLEILETPMTRRDAVKLVGCLVCAGAFSALAQDEEEEVAITPTQVVLEGELANAEEYKLVTLGERDAIVYASATEIPGSLQWGNVWLVAFSRYCTHKGTKIEEPVDGIMHCPKHGQDYDATTGAPVGPKEKTKKPLKAYALEVKDNNVWITGVVA